jgi:drug/metabolite transporter (DMT)-like permease
MSGHLAAGIGVTLVSASFYNVGMVIEKLAIRRLPSLHARRSVQMVRTLFAEPLWTLGFACLLLGLGCQVIALILAPISIVQAASAFGIVLLLVLSHVVLGDRLGAVEYAGIGAVLVALALLALSVDPRADHVSRSGSLLTLIAVSLPVVAASFVLFAAADRIGGSSVRRRQLRAPIFGLASGLLYGVSALGVKFISTIVEHHGLVGAIPHVLGSAALYVLVVSAALGFLMFQTALQRTAASVFVPVNNVVSSAFFVVVGTTIFHEHLPNATEPLVLRLCSFALIVAGLFALAIGKEVELTHERPDDDDAPNAQRTPIGRHRDNGAGVTGPLEPSVRPASSYRPLEPDGQI